MRVSAESEDKIARHELNYDDALSVTSALQNRLPAEPSRRQHGLKETSYLCHSYFHFGPGFTESLVLDRKESKNKKYDDQ